MKEQFCDYNISLRLKELGFDEPCLAYYTTGTDVTLDKDGNPTNFVLLSAKLRGELVGHGSVKNSLFKWLLEHDRTSGELYTLSRSITAPLWQQAIDWFREKHGMIISPAYDHIRGNGNYLIWFYNVKMKRADLWDLEYKSYEEAREQSIIKAIEILEENE